tara:strand:+ start:1999 stop:2442 length:444 start_codon:yes stop_codon:yes gene_type:complete
MAGPIYKKMDPLADLAQARTNLGEANQIINRYDLDSPTLAQLNLAQRQLETEHGRTGWINLALVGATALVGGGWAWLTSKQLTESTDYKTRAKCFDEQMKKNGGNTQLALQVCGLDAKPKFSLGNINLVTLGALTLSAVVLFRLLRK